MKKFFFLLIVYFFALFTIQGQIVEKNIRDIKLSLDIEYKQLYQVSLTPIIPLVDHEVGDYRPPDTNDYYSPFQHNALYFSIGTRLTYKGKYSLYFRSYFEQPNWSFGHQSTWLGRVFPVFLLSMSDSIYFKKRSVFWSFNMGDLYSISESRFGLRAYNIDVQGVNASLNYQNYFTSILYVADMSQSIGLRMDEYFRVKLGRRFKLLDDKNWQYIDYSITSDLSKNVFNGDTVNNVKYLFSLGFDVDMHISDEFNISFIGDYMINPVMISSNEVSNAALLVKMNYTKNFNKSSFQLNPSFRFYGINYRALNYENSYFGDKYRYRRENHPYSDGFFYYPYKNYFRPVSQFALYSEYQNVKDVYSLELSSEWDWNISGKIHSLVNVELISIFRDSQQHGNNYTYMFYKYYLYFEMFKSFKLGIYISNKQMNRDVQYQTFYQMKYPFFGFHFSYNGAFDIKSTKLLDQ